MAVVTLASLRVIPRIAAWTAFAVAIMLVALLAPVRLGAPLPTAIQNVVWSCALLSLAFSICASVATQGTARDGDYLASRHRLPGLGFSAALLLGTVALTIQSIILTMRVIYVTMDLLSAFPVARTRTYGYGPQGLWSLGLVYAACVIALVSTGRRQLFATQLWIGVMTVVWASLLRPVWSDSPHNLLRGTGATFVLMVGLSLLLLACAVVACWIDRRHGRPAARWMGSNVGEAPSPWPGLQASGAILALAVMLLVCYHLAVPIAMGSAGFRASAIVLAASAAIAAAAAFLLTSRSWLGNLADVALGLGSFACCAIAVSLVPAWPDALAERYPLVFNAMVVGLGVAMAGCTWLATSEREGFAGDREKRGWQRWIPHAQRMAFANAVLALVIAGMMALWPRLRSIATPDISIARVTAGFGGNLFLLLVMLWCSRRLKRLTFDMLTALALLSTIGFMVVRMLPYSSLFG